MSRSLRFGAAGGGLAVGLAFFEAWSVLFIAPYLQGRDEIVHLLLVPAVLAAGGAAALGGLALASGSLAATATVETAAASAIVLGLLSIDEVSSDPRLFAGLGIPPLLLVAGSVCAAFELLCSGRRSFAGSAAA